MSFLIRNIKLCQNKNLTRCFSKTFGKYDKSIPTVSTPLAEAEKFVQARHKVNNLERRILVWTGKFKNINEVPATVAPETMEKARNKARIRLANYMMVATLIACVFMAISGKRALERGDTVHKANIEWHKRVKEDDLRKKKEAEE